MCKKLFLCAVIFFTVTLWGQEVYFSSGQNYQVYSDISQTHAEDILARLEAYSLLFEEVLHYPRAGLSAPLKVKVKADRDGYLDYLKRHIENPKDVFLFLQYTDPARSELVCYDPDDGSFESKLVHHSFIQYMKTFIPNPPLWLQKGMAIYMEKSVYYSETDTALFRENLEWTNTLQKFLQKSRSISTLFPPAILSINVDFANSNIQEFYAQSWGLVHFLMNSEKRMYNRIMWDILANLSTDADREENQNLVMDYGFAWVDMEVFKNDYREYSMGIRTFADLVREGIALYGEKSYQEAKDVFLKAIALDPEYDVPYYYLGLVSYELKDYSMAEFYYQKSLEKGGNPQLAYYALGISAFSEYEYEKAVDYLKIVIDEDPEGYGVKAGEIMERIEFEISETSSGA